MSQKVRIERVSIRGAAPFVGLTGGGEPSWSRQPERVMEWLCDGWRYRFNAFRSRRSTFGPGRSLIPIGDRVDERTLAQTRAAEPFIAAIPTLVAESAEKIENTEWWSAISRRETLRAKGVKPGRIPTWKKRKQGLGFVCWFNGGRNAVYRRTGRKSGIVEITGQNPARFRQPGEAARFSVRIHVRVSEPIRPYTSVNVDWTRRTLVFTNPPAEVPRTPTGTTVGVDRGVVRNLATSDGQFYDLDREKLIRIDRQIRGHQKAMARAVKASPHPTQSEYRKAGASRRFLQHDFAVKRLHARAARIVTDAQHKATTDLVRRFDSIAIEDLNPAMMLRKTAPVPDLMRPGKYLPNGRAAKRGLSRAIAGARIGQLETMLTYKAKIAGVTILPVPAYYTSQRCSACGVIDKEARENQADFTCRNPQCDNHAITVNADTNAAKNISWVAHHNQGRGLSPRVEGSSAGNGRVTAPVADPTKREPREVASATPGIPRL